VATGTLIAESIRVGAALDGVALTVRRVERVAPTNLSDEQRANGLPDRWTLLHFEVDDADAPVLADGLAQALDESGWYADFHTERDSFVVYARHVFRYPKGDPAGREEAKAHGREHGVPEAQLDWPEATGG
jgi:hypothetical protein